MKGDAKVVDYLNKALRSELTAINQYWIHYRMLDNWGYKDLAKKWRKESIEEMQHADKITVRIIFLEGFGDDWHHHFGHISLRHFHHYPNEETSSEDAGHFWPERGCDLIIGNISQTNSCII